MLLVFDRARSRAVVAFAALSFIAPGCKKAPPPGPHPIAAAQPSSSGYPQPTRSSPAASSGEPLTVAPTASTSSPHPSATVIAGGPVVIDRVEVLSGERTHAARLIHGVKQAFVRCYQRALERRSARGATLQGRLRLRLSVAPSGKVTGIDVPHWDPTNPSWELGTAGSPMPNPTNPRLHDVFIPCIEAQIRQSPLGVAEEFSTITVDVRVP